MGLIERPFLKKKKIRWINLGLPYIHTCKDANILTHTQMKKKIIETDVTENTFGLMLLTWYITVSLSFRISSTLVFISPKSDNLMQLLVVITFPTNSNESDNGVNNPAVTTGLLKARTVKKDDDDGVGTESRISGYK